MRMKKLLLGGTAAVGSILFTGNTNQASADQSNNGTLDKANSSEQTVSNANQKTYTVKAGDTFWSISKEHNIDLQKLQSLNNDKDAKNLHVGDIIKLDDQVNEEYTVKVGDTLYKIAKEQGINLNTLMQLNGKSMDNTVIHVGETLKLSGQVQHQQVQQKPVVQQTNYQPKQIQQKVDNPSTGLNLNATNGSVSVQELAAYMSQKTGGNQGTWARIITIESRGNISAVNAGSGAYGVFQLLGHGEHSGMTLGEQINMAIGLYNASGFQPWLAFE